MFESPRFKKYFLPGFVFQSMVIGGGYGTGRELVEFFLRYGPLGGLLGMLFRLHRDLVRGVRGDIRVGAHHRLV